MKKLLLLTAILFSAINTFAQTNPLTVSFRGNTPVNSKDTIAYNYTGKIGGYGWLYNAEYIRTNFAPITGGGYVPLTRTISTGLGLSGGGDLSANRTHIVDTVNIVHKNYFNSVIGTAALARINTKADLNQIPFVTPEQYGAVGNGTTDDSPAFTLALASGKNIYLTGGKTYKITSTISLNLGQSIFADGKNATIKFTGITAIQAHYHSTISGIKFLGNKSGASSTSERAVVINNVAGVTIQNCYADNIATAAFFWYNTQSISGKNSIINNNVSNSTVGYKSGLQGEYVTLTSNNSIACDTGIVNLGGNNTDVNGQYNYNTIGIYQGSDGVNAGHSQFVGTTANHNTTNLIVNGLSVSDGGFVYSTCNFESGSILIKNSSNIVFNACTFNIEFASTLTNDNSTLRIYNSNLRQTSAIVYSEINGGMHVFRGNNPYWAYTNSEYALWASVGILASSDFINQGASNQFLRGNAAGSLTWSTFTDLTAGTGLGAAGVYNPFTARTFTVNLSTGLSGGQTAIGGTGASENLTLSSTSNGTKGKIKFGTSEYYEVDNILRLTNSRADGSQIEFKSSVDTSFNYKAGRQNTGGWRIYGMKTGFSSFLFSSVDGNQFGTNTAGNFFLYKVPTTSAGTYDILTRNTSTGEVEKISSALAGYVDLTTNQTIAGIKTFSTTISATDIKIPSGGITYTTSGGGTLLLSPPTTGASAYGQYFQPDNGTIALTKEIVDAINTATDANYTISAAVTLSKLPVITANRTVSIPAAVGNVGRTLKIWNQNTSGTFSWSFTGATVKDAANNTITTVINSSVYVLESDGTNWVKIN